MKLLYAKQHECWEKNKIRSHIVFDDERSVPVIQTTDTYDRHLICVRHLDINNDPISQLRVDIMHKFLEENADNIPNISWIDYDEIKTGWTMYQIFNNEIVNFFPFKDANPAECRHVGNGEYMTSIPSLTSIYDVLDD